MSTASVVSKTSENATDSPHQRPKRSKRKNRENPTSNQINTRAPDNSNNSNPHFYYQTAWMHSYGYYDQEAYYSQAWSAMPANPQSHRQQTYQNPNRRQNQQTQRRGQPSRSEQPTQRRNVTNASSSRNSARQQGTQEPENLRSNLTEQLNRGNYECMICINRIQREQPIWSCEICYKMFHLYCTRKWAKSGDSGTDQEWRCPGCQYSYSQAPSYRCFCLKRENPTYQPGDTPHSCGERCGKRLNKKSDDCRHQCTELCHPGPCPTCHATVTRSCLCGRESHQMMCSSTTIMKCTNPCGKLKTCQKHMCQAVCHSRQCEPCDVLVKQICASHGVEREVLCTEETANKDIYTCGQVCNKLLLCGHHRCQRSCHEGPCSECDLLPENRQYCACGKTKIDNQDRRSCEDPLITCTEICGKLLSCGSTDNNHYCVAPCHNGPCPSCDKETNLRCRCGQTTKISPCSEVIQYDPFKNPYLCNRRCNKKKICGKHRCNELCCDRDVHVCEVVCGKVLGCGNHACEELCHRGTCRPCQIVSYDELACRCGRTVQHPPVKCGTPLPACNFPCNRTHSCEHTVYHNCHDEDQCPPCVHLVTKRCVGDHINRDNIPCHLKDVFCGQACGKMLSCGVHKCQRSCHAGPCQSNDQTCTQRCSIKRRDCDHPCNAVCHPNKACPSTTCKETIRAQCPCGRLEKEFICNIKSNDDSTISDDNTITQSLMEALSLRSIDITLARKQKTDTPQVDCDEQCLIIQRNRKLAQAFSIDPEEPRLNAVVYTDFLKDYAKKNIEFVIGIERDFAQLVDDTQRLRANKRCHSFKAMKKNERHVVHELASFYGLETQAMDPEPNRNVVAYSILGVCKIPQITLSETVRREKMRIPPPVLLQSENQA